MAKRHGKTKLPERRRSEVMRAVVEPAIKEAVLSTAPPGEVSPWIRDAILEKLGRESVASSAGAS